MPQHASAQVEFASGCGERVQALTRGDPVVPVIAVMLPWNSSQSPYKDFRIKGV